MINETLGVISTIYKHPDRKLFYIDFDKVGDRVPGLFYALAIFGWFLLVSRNFYGLRKFSGPITDFLNAERTLGSYSFSINSLLIFILILGISAIVSQVVSFFASEPGDQRNRKRQPGLGSWLLLVRIVVLSIGIFLAFAAAGIPLDRLTLVLGALGVGIGLGLQGLVSNLVSGLIIAFEKPVNVGDIIEVNGNLGTMQSIGFRSCVVKLIDGPSLIVPNSDLLSQHLVNWTMGHNHRRLNIVVSVAYDSHLPQVKAILERVLNEHEKVLKNPEPLVAAKSFEDSSVDFDLYFWIAHIKETIPIKNDILSRVHEAFRLEGITIPFPQTDLHIVREKGK
jgi:small-conductance mechanosensitive channel